MSTITEPGIVDGMPMEVYHGDPCPTPALSNSIIKPLLKKSPYHAWLEHPRLNPNVQRNDSSKFDIGTASHALLLEGADRCTVVDAEDWRTAKAREQRDAAYAAGKTPLLASQYEAVQTMVLAARDYLDRTDLRGILQAGKPEQSMFWREEGIWIKARTDYLTHDRSVILDYKSTGLASPDEWMRAMLGHGYDVQSTLYPKGLSALGHRHARFVFLVQETCAPYQCYLVEPSASMVELAEMKIARAVRLWADCLKRKRWPSYPTAVQAAYAPQWALVEEETLK